MEKKLLLVVAINEELKVVKKLLSHKTQVKTSKYPLVSGVLADYPVDVLLTSMGMKAAFQATSNVLNPEKYAGVLVAGYCGGLALTLKIGDSVIASKVLGPEKMAPRFDTDEDLCDEMGRAYIAEGLTYRNVPLITQPLVIETPEDKRKLFEETLAEAVDMESYEVLRAAQEVRVPGVVLKIVIDDVETELPNFNDYFEKNGKMDHLNVTPVLMAQPALSLKLSKFMKRAAQVLEKGLPQIVPVVCKHWGIKPEPSQRTP